MDNEIFLGHRNKKIYKEKNLLLFSKGDKVKIAEDVLVEQYSTMPHKSFASVGAFSFPTCYFPGNVKIGRFCSIASSVKILGGNHPLNRFTTHMVSYNGEFDKFAEEAFNRRWVLKPFMTTPQDPVIGTDVWIGNDVVLKGGIVINDGAIVAANSIVTKDVPPYAVVAGVPAKIVKYRFSPEIIEQLLKIRWWNYHYFDLPDNSHCDDIDYFVTAMSDKIAAGNIKKAEYKSFNLTEEFRRI
jgi:acetyltransferase-like isoleucine patch superfamily enzyme